MENRVIVIDQIMGMGKTSYAIQYINEHPELSFIYCTPFLDEVQRIKQNCKNSNFKEPTYDSSKKIERKIDSFNDLLMNGENIVLTHSTFANANDDTVEFIENSNYVLILDETLNTLENFNDVCSDNTQKVSKADIKMLQDVGFIEIDDYGKVKWTGESYAGGKFTDVEKYAKNGTLLYLDQSMLVWQFPAHIFKLFKDVIILTYLFDGSILKPYLQYHGFDWTVKGLAKTDGKYHLTDYCDNKETLENSRKLITIFDNEKLNNYKNKSLSKSWYKSNKAKLQKGEENELEQLKKNLSNYFRNIQKAKAKDILWTCPKEYMDQLKGAGYTAVRKLQPDEKHLPIKEREKVEKQLSCFLPCNARATNDFKERSVLAYCSNMYLNPYIKRYFEKKNLKDGTKIEVNEDLFALSCMVQWIWRSQIRDGKPISVYIPSCRMRQLFKNWLYA